MIRGHIDFVSRTRVEGWLHSEQLSLAGAQLLAFVDDDCVGAGLIEIFRGDLAEAGIGDGMAGFGFGIDLRSSHDERCVDIRLAGGDVLLRQQQAALLPRDVVIGDDRRTMRDPGTLAWLRQRGWLTAVEYELLRRMDEFGVALWPLPPTAAAAPTTALAGALTAPFEMLLQTSVEPMRIEVASDADLESLRLELRQWFPVLAPLVALWPPHKACINVLEGSHLSVGWGSRRPQLASGVDYEFGRDQLLWLNLDAAAHFPTGGLTTPVLAIVPRRRRSHAPRHRRDLNTRVTAPRLGYRRATVDTPPSPHSATTLGAGIPAPPDRPGVETR